MDEKYYASEKNLEIPVAHKKRHEEKGNGFGFKVTNPYEENASAITTRSGSGNETYVPIKLRVVGSMGGKFESTARIYDSEGLSPTLLCRGDESRCVKVAVYPCMNPGFLVMKQKEPRFRADGEPAHTLTTFARHGVALGDPLRIRRLTAREYWRLQDFTDEQYDIASAVVSENQLYKQAGNSITVRVLEEIFRNLYLDRKVDKRVNTLYSFERNDK